MKPCGALVRDGESHNLSWNCGEEGESKSPEVLRLRGRQMRNMAAALLLSHGVPMVQMGDEYGHTKVPSVQHKHLHQPALFYSLRTGCNSLSQG